MENATENQIKFGQALGVDVSGLSKQKASKVLDAVKPQFRKTTKEPSIETFEKKTYSKPSSGTPTSFYVAYSKDLLIAMIEHAAATKNESFDIIEASNLAVQIIGGMRAQFDSK